MSKLFIFLKPVGREVKHLPKKNKKLWMTWMTENLHKHSSLSSFTDVHVGDLRLNYTS